MALHEVAITRTNQLRQRASAFCSAFLDLPHNPPDKLLSEHFGSEPRITEHGPSWASSRLPFLGKTFSGTDQCKEYFSSLSEVLAFEPSEDTFPGPKGLVVDADAVGPDDTPDQWGAGKGVVSVVGKAVFRSVKTAKSWEEQFIYRLSGFNEYGKIGHWEVWADPLSAWKAAGGEELGS